MNGGEDEVVDKFREYSDEISEKMTSKSVLSEIFTFWSDQTSNNMVKK